MNSPTPWHRLFGLSLVDFFRGMPVTVELEKDLSLKQQRLDVAIIRKQVATLPCRLPDGFEDLADHNLVTFKSYQEALDVWTLLELIAHYVNYRKQVSPSMQELLPESAFRLFAVAVRSPQGLAQQMPVQAGVYDVPYLGGSIRVIVVHELPQQEQNAMLHLFSARSDQVRYGATHYQVRSSDTSTLLQQLFDRYRPEEARHMSRLLEQDDLFAKMTPEEVFQRLAEEAREEVLKWVPVEELLKRVPAEERLKGVPAEERLKGVPAEERLKGLSVDELLSALPPEARAALAQRLTEKGSSSK